MTIVEAGSQRRWLGVVTGDDATAPFKFFFTRLAASNCQWAFGSGRRRLRRDHRNHAGSLEAIDNGEVIGVSVWLQSGSKNRICGHGSFAG